MFSYMGDAQPIHGADGAGLWKLSLLRRSAIRPFLGVTLPLTIIYAPIVTYVLWLHFMNYAGPRWVLFLPALSAVVSGYADHKLSAFRCAVLLTCAAYAMAVADSVRESLAGVSPWYEIPMTAVFAAVWFSTAIFVSTMVLVMSGRAIWLLHKA
jgi:hypothetical protein